MKRKMDQTEKKRKKTMQPMQDLPDNSKGCAETVERLDTLPETAQTRTITGMVEDTLTIAEEDAEEVAEDSKEEAMEGIPTLEEETADNRGLEENVFIVELVDTKKRIVERRKQKKSEQTKPLKER